MFFFGKVEKEVIEGFRKHLDLVEETLKVGYKYIEMLVHNGSKDEKEKLYEEAHRLEHTADEVRRETEMKMYSGAFLPNFRGDLLGLIESVDKIANLAEGIVNQLHLQNMDIPEKLGNRILDQYRYSIKTYEKLKKALSVFFEDLKKAQTLVLEVEKAEAEEDVIERENVRLLFEMTEISDFQKILLKELILNIGNLADLSEDTSDRLEIVILKRNA